MEHKNGNEFDRGYDYGFSDGYSQGRYEVLNTIAEIVKENEYPEYLKMEGIIN